MLQNALDGWQLQSFKRWLGDATLALRGKRFARWAQAMYLWMRVIELARDLSGAKHRPAKMQNSIGLREDFWQLPRGLDLRSAAGHRAKNRSVIALTDFILKLRGVWITPIRWLRLVSGLGWARHRFAKLDLGIAKFDLHVMQDLRIVLRQTSACAHGHAPSDAMPRPTQGIDLRP